MHATHSPGNDGVSKLLSVMLTPPLPHLAFHFSSKGVEYSVVCIRKTCTSFLRKHLRAVDCSRKQPPHFLNSKDICHLDGLLPPIVAIMNTPLTLHDLSLSLNSLDRPLQALRAVYTVEANSWRREKQEKSGKQPKKRSLKVIGEIWHTSCLQRQL